MGRPAHVHALTCPPCVPKHTASPISASGVSTRWPTRTLNIQNLRLTLAGRVILRAIHLTLALAGELALPAHRPDRIVQTRALPPAPGPPGFCLHPTHPAG